MSQHAHDPGMSNPYREQAPPPEGRQPGSPEPAGDGQGLSAPAGLATAAVVLAVVYTLYRIVLAVLAVPATEAWKDAAAQGLTYNQTEVLAYDIAAVLSVPLQIGMYVVGCLWLQRSYRIAVSVSPDYRMRRSVVWVWLGWWVPIVNLWFPFQVVEDVRKATLRGRSMIGAMGSWWTVWLGTVLIDRILTRLTGGTSGDRPLTDAVSLYASLEIAVAVMLVIGCVLWVTYIRELTKAQLA